jgi:hypothetical protein
MMSKKDYQLFADNISQIEDENKREEAIRNAANIFKKDNFRFDEERFREWIRRRRAKESMKGMRYNPKHMPLGNEDIMRKHLRK